MRTPREAITLYHVLWDNKELLTRLDAFKIITRLPESTSYDIYLIKLTEVPDDRTLNTRPVPGSLLQNFRVALVLWLRGACGSRRSRRGRLW